MTAHLARLIGPAAGSWTGSELVPAQGESLETIADDASSQETHFDRVWVRSEKVLAPSRLSQSSQSS